MVILYSTVIVRSEIYLKNTFQNYKKNKLIKVTQAYLLNKYIV